MDSNLGRRSQGSRCVALVGPYLSGKTTLLEAILFRTGATRRQGKISEKSTIGDASPEARGHGMSVELNVATTDYLGERYTFLDCPGSIEFNQDIGAALDRLRRGGGGLRGGREKDSGPATHSQAA